MVPRLRPKDVLARGVRFGLIGIVPLSVVAFCIADHHDREEFPSVVGGISLIFGAVLLVVGAGFWWASGGDARRWRTIEGHTAAATVVGPAAVRLGALLVVLGPAAIGLYHVVDAAPYGSWLYSY